MSLAACATGTFNDPSAKNLDDSKIAILKDNMLGLISEIRHVDTGRVILTKKRGVRTGWANIRLIPGKYQISYGGQIHRAPAVSGQSTITLQAGHKYQMTDTYCYILCAIATKMDFRTFDFWIEDLNTKEWVAGCRQGRGCIRGSTACCHSYNNGAVLDPQDISTTDRVSNVLKMI
jgi:hypothetical protein